MQTTTTNKQTNKQTNKETHRNNSMASDPEITFDAK
jgi:hypothetical protein